MEVVRARFKESGLSLQDLGEKMGFEPPTARQAAFQFLRVSDPRYSSLKRFARALGIPLRKLTGD
jgi:transcriptional regulator with XRE-family HTH domain